MSVYERLCGRCGHPIKRGVDEEGRLVKACICLIRYDDEKMPSAWQPEKPPA